MENPIIQNSVLIIGGERVKMDAPPICGDPGGFQVSAESELGMVIRQLQSGDYDLVLISALAQAVVVGFGHRLINTLTFVLATLRRGPLSDCSNSSDVFEDLESSLLEALGFTDRIVNLFEGYAPTWTTLDMNSVIRNVVEQLQLNRKRDIDFRWDPAAMPLLVIGDELLLSEAYHNILVNALEAMKGRPANHLRIDVSRAVGTREVVVSFTDTGYGIVDGESGRVFERSYTTKPDELGYGRGVGLWFCRKVIFAHGGEIEADSKPGEGTVVRVKLPVQER